MLLTVTCAGQPKNMPGSGDGKPRQQTTVHILILYYTVCHLLCPVLGHYIFCNNVLYWYNAHETCRRNGFALTKVDSEAKQQDVLKFIEGLKTFRVIFRNIWLGLSYDAQQSGFKWTDGTILNSTFWNSESPFAPLGDYPYVQMEVRSGDWKNTRLDVRSQFVCEERDSPDPQVPASNMIFSTIRSFIKGDTTISSTNGHTTTLFRRGVKGRQVYSYTHDVVLEDCVLRCVNDELCVAAVFTAHRRGREYNYCVLHKDN